jgi:hypothetical protein
MKILGIRILIVPACPNLIRQTGFSVMVALWLFTFNAVASNLPDRAVIRVPYGVWAILNQQQRDLVSSQYAVEVADKGRFAKIINVQGINESTSGTTGGTQLGSVFGQAQYIDKSNWNNYSARSQLGAGLIGAIIGSALDAPAHTMYRIVYTLKNSDGSVSVVERVSQSPIYVAPGLCVDTASFTPVGDSFCEDVLPLEIRSIIGQAENQTTSKTGAPASSPQQVSTTPAYHAQPQAISSGGIVLCRLGSTSSVPTTSEQCLQAGGTIQ